MKAYTSTLGLQSTYLLTDWSICLLNPIWRLSRIPDLFPKYFYSPRRGKNFLGRGINFEILKIITPSPVLPKPPAFNIRFVPLNALMAQLYSIKLANSLKLVLLSFPQPFYQHSSFSNKLFDNLWRNFKFKFFVSFVILHKTTDYTHDAKIFVLAYVPMTLTSFYPFWQLTLKMRVVYSITIMFLNWKLGTVSLITPFWWRLLSLSKQGRSTSSGSVTGDNI